MQITRPDDLDLLAEMHAGGLENPLWQSFLLRLQTRCAADEALLVFGHGPAPIEQAAIWNASGTERKMHPDELSDLNQLRTGRVYSFEESPAFTQMTRAPFGRLIKLEDPDDWTGWLILARESHDLAAANSALLSALALHLAIALRNFSALEKERFRAAVAADIATRAGFTWSMTDAGSGPAPTPDHSGTDGGRLVLPTPAGATTAPNPPSTISVQRTLPTMSDAAIADFQNAWSLSHSEARLAGLIADGKSITEAAPILGLTIETARNYSKRLYAKTGVRGQADLVRLVLTDVSLLANTPARNARGA